MSHQHVSSSHRPLGAVPVKNEKGAMTMQKVKVQRYISGRRPEYANERSGSSEEEESDNEMDIRSRQPLPGITNQRGQLDSDDEEDLPRRSRGEASHSRRPVEKPQILNSTSQDSEGSEDEDGDVVRRRRREREVIDAEAIDDDEAAEEENIERRHELIKQRIAQLEIAQQQHRQSGAADDDAGDDDEDEAAEEDEEDEESEGGDDDEDEAAEEDEEDEDSEYEEFSDSEDEGMPRLKPIFVSKKDRITIIEKEEEEERRLAAAEAEKKLVAEQRRRATMKLVEDERRREEEEEAQARAAAEEEAIIKGIAALLTDDEDEETGFELWKVRELKRIKREKEEEEAREKERAEIERLRNMTEEERQAELEANPRQITNKAEKGKYKFMQKYYHRGVFYLDEEAPVLKRDTAQPTLEDHFDKTVLPSVMQVKNFGRAGRTKYTHLVDQDTTAFDHAWGDKNNSGAIKYHSSHGGGMKQVFERPGKRKKPEQ
ncbi:PREDICTED: microfibrillar-associated protein 1-like [Rhagoletis zephyria]|uniref:microfibrillar-associated protein 1-like n=1 Tax=Rhagoletis zephyria TaxID=28612 RepID=UPI000811A0D9|nr:PREDICTED: microfibrillar-associated protein 1-like [Rhagoletis zephyria]